MVKFGMDPTPGQAAADVAGRAFGCPRPDRQTPRLSGAGTFRPGSRAGSAQSFIIKWQNELKFNFKQSHICFSRKPCRFRDPVALAFWSSSIERYRGSTPAFMQTRSRLRPSMTTKGEVLRYAIAFALRRSRKIIRGLKEGLTEEERYAVADHAVAQLKERGDPWRLNEETPTSTPPST